MEGETILNCLDLGKKSGAGEGARYIVVVGNPNVGKTALFNGLTGLYADVSNYPGTTVDVCYGRAGKDIIIDTPGVYSISSFTGEEKLVRDLVLTAGVVINVVDTANLERDLFLTLHLLDLGLTLIVALNMSDEMADHGIKVDRAALERVLGVPVVSTVAVTKKGLASLLKRLPEACRGTADPRIVERVAEMSRELGASEAEALLLLEGDSTSVQKLNLSPGIECMQLYRRRRERVNEVVGLVASNAPSDRKFLDFLGQIMIRPVTGFPILFLAMALMYLVVGVVFAQLIVNYTQGRLMEGYYEPFVRSFLSGHMDLSSPAGIVLAGQFGFATMVITYILGLLAPLVVGFFFVLSVLEDSGYLPRIAILMDRLLATIGLNGLAVIPLVLGFGCVTAATITTRLLPTDRERRIAIFLLALAVPCSAQLAFVTAIISRFGFIYFILYLIIILMVVVAAGSILSRALPGETTPLLLGLPRLRCPRLNNVITKTWLRSWHFLKEAFPLFVGGALFLSILEVTGSLGWLQNSMDPLTVTWLNLPKESANAFIMGIIRRDFGTAGILSIPMSSVQQFVAVVTMTLFVPCIASVMIIFKERGWKEGLVIWFSVLSLAVIIGGLFSRLLSLLAFAGDSMAPVLLIALLVLLMSGVIFLNHNEKRVYWK